MARLDYALFRLALITLFNAENRTQLTEIRDRLFGSVPVLSDAVKAAVHANKAVNQATTLVDDLLNLSFSSAGPFVVLLPLYRDSLELNMWVLIDNLTRACSAYPTGVDKNSDGSFPRSFTVEPGKVCQTLVYATQIMNDGNGDLRLWREFVRNLNYATSIIDAYEPHFFSVTKLMYRSCRSVLGDTSSYSTAATIPAGNKCQVALANAISKAAMSEYGIKGEYGQIYTAWLRGPTRLARSRSREQPAQASGPKDVRPKPDTESTGSIPQSGASSPSVSH